MKKPPKIVTSDREAVVPDDVTNVKASTGVSGSYFLSCGASNNANAKSTSSFTTTTLGSDISSSSQQIASSSNYISGDLDRQYVDDQGVKFPPIITQQDHSISTSSPVLSLPGEKYSHSESVSGMQSPSSTLTGGASGVGVESECYIKSESDLGGASQEVIEPVGGGAEEELGQKPCTLKLEIDLRFRQEEEEQSSRAASNVRSSTVQSSEYHRSQSNLSVSEQRQSAKSLSADSSDGRESAASSQQQISAKSERVHSLQQLSAATFSQRQSSATSELSFATNTPGATPTHDTIPEPTLRPPISMQASSGSIISGGSSDHTLKEAGSSRENLIITGDDVRTTYETLEVHETCEDLSPTSDKDSKLCLRTVSRSQLGTDEEEEVEPLSSKGVSKASSLDYTMHSTIKADMSTTLTGYHPFSGSMSSMGLTFSIPSESQFSSAGSSVTQPPPDPAGLPPSLPPPLALAPGPGEGQGEGMLEGSEQGELLSNRLVFVFFIFLSTDLCACDHFWSIPCM